MSILKNKERRAVFTILIITSALTLFVFQNCGVLNGVMKSVDFASQTNETQSMPQGSDGALDPTTPTEKVPYPGRAFILPAILANGHNITWDARIYIGTGTIKSAVPSVRGLSSVGEISKGTILRTGDSRTFSSLRLSVESNGNLVLYKNQSEVWSSRTGSSSCNACLTEVSFQGDGNLVIHRTIGSNRSLVFFSQTQGNANARFLFYDSSPYFAIVNTSGDAVFSAASVNAKGWIAKVFRPEALSEQSEQIPISERVQRSFSQPYEWLVGTNGVNDPSQFTQKGVEVFPVHSVNALSLFPDPTFTENPFRSDASGSPVVNGQFMTYKAFMMSQNDPEDKSQFRIGFSKVDIIVKNPMSSNAEILSMKTNGKFETVSIGGISPHYSMDPSVTVDGRLMIYFNLAANGTSGIPARLYYTTRAQGSSYVTGWSAPKPVSEMYRDPELGKRYPFARYPLRDSEGNIFSGPLIGSYTWISPDGTDLFWDFMLHDNNSRHAGVVAAGASTKGLVRLVDGGPNNSRRGCVHANNASLGETIPCTSAITGSFRLFMSSLGRTPGMWSPMEYTDNKVLPLTDKLFTYPMFTSNSNRYFEVSFEETMAGNYEVYLEMSEGVTKDGEYLLNVTPDVSGNFFVPRLNNNVHFAEEVFEKCNDRVCLENNFESLSPSVPLFSGKPLYFDGAGAITINPTSATGVQMLNGAQDLTVSLAVRPLKSFGGANNTATYTETG